MKLFSKIKSALGFKSDSIPLAPLKGATQVEDVKWGNRHARRRHAKRMKAAMRKGWSLKMDTPEGRWKLRVSTIGATVWPPKETGARAFVLGPLELLEKGYRNLIMADLMKESNLTEDTMEKILRAETGSHV